MPLQTETAPGNATGDKFAFGLNWRRFLESVDESRINAAVDSLERMLGPGACAEKRFLDAGCGSGLFSLAAVRSGARVLSFDADPESVACTEEIRRRFGPAHAGWTVRQGSLLDAAFLSEIRQFDMVYCWGVVHHTGEMWKAIDLLQRCVAPGGLLWLAVYNDQGLNSRIWKQIKSTYNQLPRVLRGSYVLLTGGMWLAWRLALRVGTTMGAMVLRAFSLRNPLEPALKIYRDLFGEGRGRGMHWWYDLVDWVGGWPFEVARPEEVFVFLRDRGFDLVELRTCGGGLGCNEFVFRRRE